MTAKAFATGSTCPPLSGDTLRLYSMRFCPYAQRTRLVLDHLKIPHEVVNINLQHKPDWFLTKNPLGVVPVLEQGKKIVYESAVCDEYLEELDGKHSLLPADPYQKARVKILMESYSKITDKFYAFFRLRQKPDEEKKVVLEDLRKAAKIYEDNLSGVFFGGDKTCMLDYHMWPWFERMPMLESIVGLKLLPAEMFPKLHSWVQAMMKSPSVKATMFDTDTHLEIMTPYLSGETVNYDIGLA